MVWQWKNYYNIDKTTIQDLEKLKRFDINTPTPPEVWNKHDIHRTEKSNPSTSLEQILYTQNVKGKGAIRYSYWVMEENTVYVTGGSSEWNSFKYITLIIERGVR